AVSGLVLVSAATCAVLALLAPTLAQGEHTSWPFVVLELVVLAAAVIGVLFGLGRYTDAPGLALACVAGTVLIGSVRGWQPSGRTVLGHPLKGLLVGRIAASVVLAALACAVVLMRDRGACRKAAIGAALLMPTVLVALASMTDPGLRVIEMLLGQSP